MTTSPNRNAEAVSDRAVDKPLVRRYARYNSDHLSNLLAMMMANVEDALIEAGAKPGLDYNHLDLLREASPFVLSMFNDDRGKPLKFTCEYWPHEVGDMHENS